MSPLDILLWCTIISFLVSDSTLWSTIGRNIYRCLLDLFPVYKLIDRSMIDQPSGYCYSLQNNHHVYSTMYRYSWMWFKLHFNVSEFKQYQTILCHNINEEIHFMKFQSMHFILNLTDLSKGNDLIWKLIINYYFVVIPYIHNFIYWI